MELTIENLESNNQLTQNEFERLTYAFYTTVSLKKNDNVRGVKQKARTIDFLITFLNDFYENQNWESDEEENQFLDILYKLHLQKELLEAFSDEKTTEETNKAIHSFAYKTQFAVGMR